MSGLTQHLAPLSNIQKKRTLSNQIGIAKPQHFASRNTLFKFEYYNLQNAVKENQICY